MAEKILCIFGDSNTWGSRPGCWADLFKYQLVKQTPPTFVYSLGILGETTGRLLERLEAEAAARNPTHVIFAIGGNDAGRILSKGRNIIPMALFKKNLSLTLKIAKKYTPYVAFLGIIDMDESKTRPIPWMPTLEYTLKERLLYDKSIMEFCQKNKVLYIPRRGLLGPKDFYDGLHPTTKGHKKIYNKIKEPVQRFLRCV